MDCTILLAMSVFPALVPMRMSRQLDTFPGGVQENIEQTTEQEGKREEEKKIKEQLIVQMLDQVGAEVLEKYTEACQVTGERLLSADQPSCKVNLNITAYPENERKDVATLSRHFENTVGKLLASGALHRDGPEVGWLRVGRMVQRRYRVGGYPQQGANV